jgi:hypothetical protein
MVGLGLLLLLARLGSAEPTATARCQELALALSGCPRHVLGLSACEEAHRSLCAIFKAPRW